MLQKCVASVLPTTSDDPTNFALRGFCATFWRQKVARKNLYIIKPSPFVKGRGHGRGNVKIAGSDSHERKKAAQRTAINYSSQYKTLSLCQRERAWEREYQHRWETTPTNEKSSPTDCFFVKWELTDSNRRPSACKADALNQLS